jgi:hypothetical protein
MREALLMARSNYCTLFIAFGDFPPCLRWSGATLLPSENNFAVALLLELFVDFDSTSSAQHVVFDSQLLLAIYNSTFIDVHLQCGLKPIPPNAYHHSGCLPE